MQFISVEFLNEALRIKFFFLMKYHNLKHRFGEFSHYHTWYVQGPYQRNPLFCLTLTLKAIRLFKYWPI